MLDHEGRFSFNLNWPPGMQNKILPKRIKQKKNLNVSYFNFIIKKKKDERRVEGRRKERVKNMDHDRIITQKQQLY